MKVEMRFAAMGEINCVVCDALGERGVPERHHLLTSGLHGNGKRLGHKQTVAICGYHHRGEHATGSGLYEAFHLGPNLADNAKAFREEWPDDRLLAETNKQLRAWCDRTYGVTYEQLGCEE